MAFPPCSARRRRIVRKVGPAILLGSLVVISSSCAGVRWSRVQSLCAGRRGTGGLAFLPPLDAVRQRAQPDERPQTFGANGAAAAALASASAAAPAWAEIGQELQGVGNAAVNLITKGTANDQVYDPSTPEGAKALGLAEPLPKITDIQNLTWADTLPVYFIFVLALFWGLYVVPNMMERADGTRTTYFEEKKPKITYDAKMLDAAVSEIVPSTRRLSKEADATKPDAKKKTQKKKSQAKVGGFKK